MTQPKPEVDPLGGLREAALAQPNRIAIIQGDVQLTFGELDALVAATASVLADALERAPLPPGSFVPAFMTHDIQSVVLMHAAFWVGVPMGLIDPSLPQTEMTERLAVLGGSRVALIAHASLAELVPPEMNVVVAASEPGPKFDPVPVDADGDFLAYFSSGSTGRAKCIVNGRRHADGALRFLDQNFGLGLRGGPIASISQFYWAGGWSVPLQLCNGRSMAIVPIDGADAGSLVEGLRTAKAESITVTPSIAQWLARSNLGPPLADLKVISLGGEVLFKEQISEAKRLMGPLGAIQIIWGASEMETFLHSWVDSPDRWADVVPIELGINEMIRLEPCDDDPAPVYGGQVGEIIVRDKVAQRYLGQPELTDLRFGVDPDGVRFWRSGDLAELLPDGTLFLRGRVDDMVKINGKLIEPAESIALLRSFPGILAAEVLPHSYPSGRIVLVAHVVADSTVSPDAVRRTLMDRLPVHVIPGVLMRHDQLPLTNSGKTDRQLLQKMSPVAWLETEAHSPEVAVEIFLLARLQDILEIDNIGIDDDFWFLGLESLGAIELLASIADAGLGELALTVLLEERTIRSLARQLGTGICQRGTDIVIFNPEADSDPVFCIPGAGGTAMSFFDLAGCLSSDHTLVAIEARGTHTNSRPDRTIGAMARRVVAAVDERQPTGIVTLLGHSAGGFIAWEAAQRLVNAERNVRLVMIDTMFLPSSVRLGLNVWQPASRDIPLFRRFTRSCRSCVAGLKERWREFKPGPPRADVTRYRAFARIMSRAIRRCEPPPARFPVLFVTSEEKLFSSGADPSDLSFWKARAEKMTVVSAAGDHFTMLQDPNVEGVAVSIAEWIDAPKGSATT